MPGQVLQFVLCPASSNPKRGMRWGLWWKQITAKHQESEKPTVAHNVDKAKETDLRNCGNHRLPALVTTSGTFSGLLAEGCCIPCLGWEISDLWEKSVSRGGGWPGMHMGSVHVAVRGQHSVSSNFFSEAEFLTEPGAWQVAVLRSQRTLRTHLSLTPQN